MVQAKFLYTKAACLFPPSCATMRIRKEHDGMEQLNLLGKFEEEAKEASSVSWNLWHGCHKISPGCQHCYVYRSDSRYGRDSSKVEKTSVFDLPIRRKRVGGFVVPSGKTVYTCFTSDFFLADADEWRTEAWDMIRQRPDLNFFFITKPSCKPLQKLPWHGIGICVWLWPGMRRNSTWWTIGTSLKSICGTVSAVW